jgi:hypothetical protein
MSDALKTNTNLPFMPHSIENQAAALINRSYAWPLIITVQEHYAPYAFY